MKTKITNKIPTRVLTILALILFGAMTITAAPGDLDASFGNGGIVTTPITSNYYDEPTSMRVQPDGKIVVCGQIIALVDGKDYYLVSFFLARYNTNGTLDASFGTNGKIIAPISFEGDYGGADIALQPDGKIVTVGETYDRKFVVYRYHANGTLDASFGSGGKVITPFVNGVSRASNVAVQPDGRIVVVGVVYAQRFDFAVVRYNTDGSLDASFGADGKVITAVGSSDDYAGAVVLQPDGKIVVVGTGYNITTNSDFALVRYNPNGSLDSSFGLNGKVLHAVSANSDGASDVALQPDGKIVAVGTSNLFASSTIVRYNADGSIDTSFAANGIFTTPSNFFSGSGVALQPDGKIVSFGRAVTTGYSFAVMRLNPNGSPDAGFGANGRVVTPIAGSNGSYSVKGAVQLDGKIVAFGENHSNKDDDIAVARYLGDSAAPRPTQFDFDGDRRADVSVFRPSNGTWYLNRSAQGFFAAQFGAAADKITPADFDGDARTDLAVMRPSNGVWYILNSSNSTITSVQFGAPEDLPRPADFDGDGKADVSVWRPSTGTWFRLNSINGSLVSTQFGAAGDVPQPADFDGDGKADINVYRPSTGAWFRLNSSDGSFFAVQFGASTDVPTAADYDGDGKADVSVFRPGNGVWYRINSNGGAIAQTQFGQSGDQPTPADYDGDGRTDAAVFRDDTWYLLQSTNGFSVQQFGFVNDKPVPAAFLP